MFRGMREVDGGARLNQLGWSQWVVLVRPRSTLCASHNVIESADVHVHT